MRLARFEMEAASAVVMRAVEVDLSLEMKFGMNSEDMEMVKKESAEVERLQIDFAVRLRKQ